MGFKSHIVRAGLLSRLSGIRSTAARFTLRFFNPRSSMYPNAHPQPQNGHTDTDTPTWTSLDRWCRNNLWGWHPSTGLIVLPYIHVSSYSVPMDGPTSAPRSQLQHSQLPEKRLWDTIHTLHQLQQLCNTNALQYLTQVTPYNWCACYPVKKNKSYLRSVYFLMCHIAVWQREGGEHEIRCKNEEGYVAIGVCIRSRLRMTKCVNKS